MILQDAVWTIALVGIGLVGLGFIHVIHQAGKPADDEARARSARTARRGQAALFALLLVIFVAGSWATLHPYPIPPQHAAGEAPTVVRVVGRMWSWDIEPATIPVRTPIEFRVTSADVNHGFAIYGPNGRILAQTQAMPGYTNKLLHTFTEPGSYTIQCLEYCGLGHAPMTATVEAVAARGN